MQDLALDISTVAAAGAPVVSIKEVTHRYGATLALDGLSLDIPSGRMVGVIGPDGVGKGRLTDVFPQPLDPQQWRGRRFGEAVRRCSVPRHLAPKAARQQQVPRQVAQQICIVIRCQ